MKGLIDLKNITLYTTHCPLCEKLAEKLDAAGVNYSVSEDTSTIAAQGFSAAPVLEVDGEFYDFPRAIYLLNEGALA